MHVVKEVGSRAVQAYDAASRTGAPVIARLGTGVTVPIDFHDKVGFPVVLERRAERKTEPGVRRRRYILGNLGINQRGRIPAVVGRKIPRE